MEQFWFSIVRSTSTAPLVVICRKNTLQRTLLATRRYDGWLSGIRDFVTFHKGNNRLEQLVFAMGCSSNPGFLTGQRNGRFGDSSGVARQLFDTEQFRPQRSLARV
jgi:hypothetical protein